MTTSSVLSGYAKKTNLFRTIILLSGVFSFSAIAEEQELDSASKELLDTATLVAQDKNGVFYSTPTDTQGRQLSPGYTYEVYATFICSGTTYKKPIRWEASGGGGVFTYSWTTRSVPQRSVIYLSRMLADNRLEFFDRIKTPYTILGLGPYKYVYRNYDHWFVTQQKTYNGNPNYYAFGVQGKDHWLGVKCSNEMVVQNYDYTTDPTWFSFERL